VNNIHYLGNYPEDMRPIIRILLNYEESLSDGYGFYSGSETQETLIAMAREILAAVKGAQEGASNE